MLKILIILRTTGKLYSNQQIYMRHKTYTLQCYDDWVKGCKNCNNSQISKHLHAHLLIFFTHVFCCLMRSLED